VAGDHLGQRRLARARRAPEDRGRQPVRLDEHPQGPPGPDQLVLADHVVEPLGPQARGERRLAGEPLLGGGREQVSSGHGRRRYREL
jgi:hypothetical protein